MFLMKWHEQELILEKVFSFLSPCDLFYTRDSYQKQDKEQLYYDGCRMVNHLFNQTIIHSEFCKYYFEIVFCLSRDSGNSLINNNSSLDGIDYDYIQFQGVKRGMTEEDPMENNELIQLPESLGFIAMIGNCDGLKWKNGFHRKLLTCIANLQANEKKNTKAIMPRLKQLNDWLDEGKQLKLQQFLTKLKLSRFMRMSFGLSRSVILTFRDDGLPVFIRNCYEPTVRFNNYEIIKSGKINHDCQEHNLFELQKEDEETFLDLFCRGIFRKNFSSYQKTIAPPKSGFFLYIEEKFKTMEFANVQEKQKFISEKRMEWYSNRKSSEVQEFTRRERQARDEYKEHLRNLPFIISLQ